MSKIAKGFIDMGETHILNQDWDMLRKLMNAHFPTVGADAVIRQLRMLMMADKKDRALKLWHVLDDYDLAKETRRILFKLTIKVGIALGVLGGIAFLGWLIFA